MPTYDEWKSTEPEDPDADERELERRDQELEPDEPLANPREPEPRSGEGEGKR